MSNIYITEAFASKSKFRIKGKAINVKKKRKNRSGEEMKIIYSNQYELCMT